MSEDTLELRVRIAGTQIARSELRQLAVDEEGVGLAAKKSSEHAATGLSTLGRGLKGLAAGVGITGIAFGIKDLVEAGTRLQQQQMNLKAAMVSAGIKGKEAYEKLEAAAVRSAEHGGFSRDQEIQSISNFVTVTKNAAAAYQANQAAVELSRGAGLNFASVQRYIQQALIGNVRRIKQYVGVIQPVTTHVYALESAHRWLMAALEQQSKSVLPANRAEWLKYQELNNQITPAQMDRAKTQDLLATSTEVLAAVHARFDNRLAAYNQSTQGRLSNLQHTWEETMGKIGEAVLPEVNKVITALTWLLNLMASHKHVVEALAIAVSFLGSVAFAKMAFNGVMSLGKALYLDKIAIGAWKVAQWGMQAALGTTTEEVEAEDEQLALLQGRLDQLSEQASTVFSEAMNQAVLANQRLAASAGLTTDALDAESAAMTRVATGGAEAGAAGGLATAEGGAAGAGARAATAGESFTAAISKVGLVAFGAQALGSFLQSKGVLQTNQQQANLTTHTGTPGGAGFNIQTGRPDSFWSVIQGLLGGAGTPNRHRFPLHKAAGGSIGPSGSDTVPAWLTPGEYVMSKAVASRIGAPALGQLDAGNLPGFAETLARQYGIGGAGGMGGLQIMPGNVTIKLDARTIAQAVVDYTLRRAARGPSSLVGGSLVTGASGPPARA